MNSYFVILDIETILLTYFDTASGLIFCKLISIVPCMILLQKQTNKLINDIIYIFLVVDKFIVFSSFQLTLSKAIRGILPSLGVRRLWPSSSMNLLKRCFLFFKMAVFGREMPQKHI